MYIGKGKKALLLSLGLTITLFSACFYGYHKIPGSVHLMEGKKQSFSLGLPLSADFSMENIGVLNVNNEKVEGNIHLSLDEPFSVEPQNTGTAEVSLSLLGVIPVKTVTVDVLPKTEIIPCGMAVGVEIDTDGVMVLGTGYVNSTDNKAYEPARGVLKSGDLIVKADGVEMKEKEDLMEVVKEKGGSEINFVIKRDGDLKNVSVTPVMSQDDNSYKLGVWVRDSTQGIGTITYYIPQNNKFGALGHGIYDVDTEKLMSVKDGIVTKADIAGIKKGEKGSPGELMGSLKKDEVLGDIAKNTEHGLYGTIDTNKLDTIVTTPMEIGLKQDIKEGEATILTNICADKIEEYKINIESVNINTANADKGMVIRITDERLLSQTNGIIQGMSGSPIIQDGKVIGAVTHVFVQDPTKGYGIFIENMLKENQQ